MDWRVGKGLNCERAQEINIVEYLAHCGIKWDYIRGRNYWYKSPLRSEKTPSFKVDDKINRWYDLGVGDGGDLIKLATLLHGCTVSEFLHQAGSLNMAMPLGNYDRPELEDRTIHISEVAPLTHPALLAYMTGRSISEHIGKQFCQQVHFKLLDKEYFSIGFKSDKGGYELRNSFSKLSSSPKFFTYLRCGINKSNRLAVFEGFFDFLSFQTLYPAQCRNTDFLILNSTSMVQKAREIMESYPLTMLYLDNQENAKLLTETLISLHPCYKDGSSLYKTHNDLNQWHIAKGQKPRIRRKLKL